MKSAMSRIAPMFASQPVVACNIYVSAGRPHHAEFLLKVLADAHNHCRLLRQKDEDIVVVHAYADGPYDRSSFHLAGNVGSVTDVASALAIHAAEGLVSFMKPGDILMSRHPFVGVVDHVSVMPLRATEDGNDIGMSLHGNAARSIGARLQENGVQVFYYGDAHPQRIPLAAVRREKTSFFHSGGLQQQQQQQQDATVSSSTISKGTATVGAPPMFVENFNIRLTANCDLKIARSLTSFLRERDGGLLGVEGLTLPYGNGRYEMAGNLLRPDLVSADAVLSKLEEWVELKLKEMPFEQKTDLVEAAYRVGTTAEECLHVVSHCHSIEEMDYHDLRVMERFEQYLTS